MKISGRALVIDGDDISADVIFPGRYLTFTDRAEQANHIFEGLGLDMPEKVKHHPVIVAGWNLGPGSAREQTATGMLGAGVKLVIAKSFSRTFFRNALNNGLPLIASPELAGTIANGDRVVTDLAAGVARLGSKSINFQPLPSYLLRILENGGIWGSYGACRNGPPAEHGHDVAGALGHACAGAATPQTLVEKIMSRSVGRAVQCGEFVNLTPDWTFALDDGIGGSIAHLQEHGVERIHNSSRVALFFDHYAPANSDHHATLQHIGRDFAARHGIHALYDVGEGISHQVAVENGLATPGQVAVSMDSHNMTLGAIGCMGIGVGNSEIAYIWATGSIWFQVPATVKVELTGHLSAPVSAKDVMLALLRERGARWASYKAIEFHGDALVHLTVSERMTLCNMGTELGAKTAIVPPDGVTKAHFRALGVEADTDPWAADPNAAYEQTCTIDLASLTPMVACPHTVDNVRPIDEVASVKIDQAFLGTCTNGRFEDLAVAALILKNRRIASGVRMIVTPASRAVMLRAVKEGIIETLIEAGCTLTTPGCGACVGIHQGVLGNGDVCIASSSRNSLGRMGNQSTAVYLGSPATVAASALAGRLCDPRTVFQP